MNRQEKRESSVTLKLNPMRGMLEGKTVLLVDDSIVRGTTSLEIVKMVEKAGAKKVYFASTSPPIKFAHIYGSYHRQNG